MAQAQLTTEPEIHGFPDKLAAMFCDSQVEESCLVGNFGPGALMDIPGNQFIAFSSLFYFRFLCFELSLND